VKSFSVNGADLWCLERGAGLPLLLVHGFPLDHTMWTGQVESLAPHCRVVAPDLPGFGRSPAKSDKATMEQFADDLAALLDALEIREPVVFCGLSMGGYIALQFCRKYAARLAGLILCDTRATADTPEAAAARQTMAARVLRDGVAPLVETMLPKLFAETTRQRQPHVIEGLRTVLEGGNPRGIAAAARGMAERPDMTAALAEIRCPMLVIVGQEDAISPPAEMGGIARAIPGAKFVVIPAAGHMSPLENPIAVNAAIAEFVSTL
jgi:pimeloyl-ACP methyl ester carboxylesterase